MSIENKVLHQDDTIFKSDSGYVSFKDGKKYLLELNKNDTIDVLEETINENDTIGKFYKKENSTNYVLYLNDLLNTKKAPSQFILEMDSKGEIIKSERYINGFYRCCWNNEFEGFGKINDYFYLKTCGSGSAFCSAQLYIFKDVFPQDELSSITKSVYNGLCYFEKNKTLACTLDSKIETKPNSLLFHYEYKKGVSKKGKKYKEIEKFDVEYKLINNNWEANDDTRLNEIVY